MHTRLLPVLLGADKGCKWSTQASKGECVPEGEAVDVDMDIFSRGLCLPSDIKMTPEQQEIVIAMIRSCFDV